MPELGPRPVPSPTGARRRRLGRGTVLAASLTLAVVLAGCSGKTTGASDFNASSNTIKLNAVGSCDTNCTAYMRYRVRGTTTWSSSSSFTVGKVSTTPFSRTVTVWPGAPYEYQACGKEASQSQFTCVGPDGTPNTTHFFTPGATDRMVFTCGVTNYEICRLNGDGSRTNLTNSPTYDTNPAQAPDGKKIAFRSDRTGKPDLFVMSANGASPTHLTKDAFEDRDPAFSPDGKKILFSTARDIVHDPDIGDYLDDELYLINPDGTGLTRITTFKGADTEPAWSPDGRMIAWVHLGVVWTMNANGTGSRPLRVGGRPAWSPDGRKIAYDTSEFNSDGRDDVFLMNPDGSNPQRLTNAPGSNGGAAYMPDGTRVTFGSETTVDEIDIIDVDGKNRRTLTGDTAFDPTWAAALP